MERSHRLRSDADFRRVRREGASFSNRFLVLWALSSGKDAVQVGFAVTKRVGKATVRNRLKRLLREATRQYLPRIASGWDMVLIARSPAAEADFHQVYAGVGELLKDAGLLEGVDG